MGGEGRAGGLRSDIVCASASIREATEGNEGGAAGSWFSLVFGAAAKGAESTEGACCVGAGGRKVSGTGVERKGFFLGFLRVFLGRVADDGAKGTSVSPIKAALASSKDGGAVEARVGRTEGERRGGRAEAFGGSWFTDFAFFLRLMLHARSYPWVLCACVAIGSATMTTSGSVGAEPPTKQEARTLFQEALAHVAAGDYTTALGKLERVATFKRTPQVGFYIGYCHEKLGKLVMALGEYRIALADAQASAASDVIAEAQEAIGRVEPRIPRLIIHRGDGAATATVLVDRKPLGESAIGQPMPFDPGTRVVVAQAAGYLPFRQEVRLAEGEKATIEIKMIKRAPGAAAPIPPQNTPERTDSSSSSSVEIDSREGSNTLAWIATGVGVVGLGASGSAPRVISWCSARKLFPISMTLVEVGARLAPPR